MITLMPPSLDRMGEALKAYGEQKAQARVQEVAEALHREATEQAPGSLAQRLVIEQDGNGAAVIAPGYARFVEFGTRFIRAQPFLRSALVRVMSRFGGRIL